MEALKSLQSDLNKTNLVKMSKGYTFRLRQHLDGNFHGLWELAMLDEKGKVAEIPEDANGLSFCLESIEGILIANGH